MIPIVGFDNGMMILVIYYVIMDAMCILSGCIDETMVQIMAFGVGVHPGLGRRLLHGCDGFGGRAKGGFVGTQSRDERGAHGPFLRFRADKGDGGRQAFGERGQ